MFKNHFVFVLRHLRRQKLNTTVHIVGLTLGIAVCILIGLFLRYELSFDNHSKKRGQIYRVNSIWKEANEQFDLYATPLPLAAAIRNEVSGIDAVVLTRPEYADAVEIAEGNVFKQEHILIAEPSFLDFFSIEVVAGDARRSLQTPYQALLTQTTATKFFGNENPMGKTFKYRGKYIITVGGIIRDLPSNCHLPASMVLSYVQDEQFLDNGDKWFFGGLAWTQPAACTYVMLHDGVEPMNIEAQLKKIALKNINSAKGVAQVISGSFELQPLHEIHFDTQRFGGGPWVPAIDSKWLWFFTGIGIAVLMLACINFLNLSTAQSAFRMKEVGVRKSIGARRTQLIFQFLSEAMVITFISGLIAVVVAKLCLPWLNATLNKNIGFELYRSPTLMVAVLIFIVITGLSAGIYPAWAVAKFNAVIALKSGSPGTRIRGVRWIRRGLVITQFVISSGLIVTVLVIAQQVNFMRSKELGFNRENIINVNFSDRKKMESLYNDLVRLPAVKQVSFIKTPPLSNDHWWNTISLIGGNERHTVCALYGDVHFYDVYGLKILSGRIPQNTRLSPGDSKNAINQVVVNEKLLKDLGLGSPEQAIGKRFWWGIDTEIVGVVQDFNVEPLQNAIPPALIFQDTAVYKEASVRFEAGTDIPKALKDIEAIWKTHFSDVFFDFSFMNQQINSFYEAEMRVYKLFRIFAIIAILISCMGLWGLITFTTQQRTKEIGIRKIMGASISSILILLIKDIFLMVVCAFVFSSPFVYYFLNEWLQSFAYKIDVQLGTFIFAGLAVAIVTTLTVTLQSLRAALVSPARSLKHE